MADKIKNTVTLMLLAAFLAGFGLWAVFKPDDAFSQSERRQLPQYEGPTVKTVVSGKFMSDFESYASDQFPMREDFRTLKALTAFYVMGKQDSEGVYVYNGHASQMEYPKNEGSLAHAAERFGYIYDNFISGSDANVYLSVIPDKNAFLAEESGHLSLDYDDFIRDIRDKTPYMQYIDITDLLELDDYYRTDIHWRQERITDVAARLAEQMGTYVSQEYTQKTLDRDYYGVYYGYASLPMAPEKMNYLTGDALDDCVVYNYETGQECGVYDMEKAYGRDPYEMFLSGSVSLLSITNPNADTDKELVIFRDSFSSSLAPLLAEGYKKITLVDIRYLASPAVGKMLEFTDQDVLFIYSVGVLNNSDTMK